MAIKWDKDKEVWLLAQRNLSFDDFADRIIKGDYLEILENLAREGQQIFLIRFNGYIHVVPFVIDADGDIVLKTVFPSRKFEKLYGGGVYEEDKA
jgi:hypothetical protein